MNKREVFANKARNVIFGVEDSLVSTVGLLSGISAAGVPRATIFLTGVILICVEAFSMSVGSFLSEQSVEEYIEKKAVPAFQSLQDGVIMFFSYFLAGFVPLLPYVLFEQDTAFWVSVIFSLLALALLGYGSARALGIRFVRTIRRMVLLGGLSILVGVLVGGLVQL